MDGRKKAMVLASFAADSLALGAHWIYDTEKIAKDFGRADRLLKPGPESFHPKKEKGEFTHYGDQTFVLLKSLSPEGGFDSGRFSSQWQALFKNYNGYLDKATKATLSNLESGKSPEEAGSPSMDIAGASRISPLVFYYSNDLDQMLKAVRTQTRMTHNDDLVMDSAEFFARVTFAVLKGSSPLKAMVDVSEKNFHDSVLEKWVKEGVETREMESVPTIARFGQSCHVEDAFPGIVHLLARYENDLEEALVQAVMGGGDSAGRGLLLGMVMGAHCGREKIPDQWVNDLKKGDEITDLLDRLS